MFMNACQNGNLSSVKSLLEINPQLLNAKDSNNNTGLFNAAKNGCYEVVEYLLSVIGVNVDEQNQDKYTALHISITLGEYDIAELLLAKGANPNVKDWCGYTPLHHAAEKRDLDMITSLLTHKADPNALGDDSNSPMHFITKYNKWIDMGIFEVFIKHGADCTMKNNKMCTPIDGIDEGRLLPVFRILMKYELIHAVNDDTVVKTVTVLSGKDGPDGKRSRKVHADGTW